ncbi:hypothetical protein AKJ47_01375 [candidate division MSBL1 archaeon SCGC-AAA261G05]|uniref:CAAX prenyl protease 2/Lysostaphin resistance protein A-like domain-containing protein n=1 Tax=candidate division MSBL1 archaeon SCGC-AAA261G05 TaxID=1698276 RepID=A0A133VBX3_9EURY|nr:hypothetical protein AKJ47_01375 [candidate division MSBL1 archaeon SCGC-AAA261G05]
MYPSLLILLAVILAELTTTFLSLSLGMFLHSIVLVSLLAAASISRGSPHSNPWGLGAGGPKVFSNFLLAASIVPLIRIFTLAMPFWFFPEVTWYLIAAIPMLAGAVTLARYQGLGAENLGLTLNRLPIQIAVGLTGVGFGLAEYFILKPDPLVGSLSLGEIIIPILILVLGTGFVEELCFRGVIQSNAVGALGEWPGLLFASLVYAGLHIGNSIPDALFVFPIGLFFGLVVLQTKSILGVTLSHGIMNTFLFVVMPLMVS